MKNLLRAYSSLGYWRHGFSFRKAAVALLSAFGALWLFVEVTSFFSPRTASWLRDQWLTFLVLGVVFALWENRPCHRIASRLRNRDVTIEVRVGDVLSAPASTAIAIGCNTTFDTDLASGIISERSVQGQFTRKYYKSIGHLDSDLSAALASVAHDHEDAAKPGKRLVYPIGTTTKLKLQGRTVYLVAIARINSHGNAEATFEDLKNSLPGLWDFIANRGDFGAVAMPVLGTGYSRIPEPRNVVLREIIQSFVAACSSQRPCEVLSIFIPPKDFYEHEVNLIELAAFLEHVCKYTNFASSQAVGRGQAIS